MTQNNLKFADHICQCMIANGMVRSQAEFSENWLDQSPSYLSSSKARQRNLKDAAIQFLFDRLELRVQNYKAQEIHMMGIKLWRDGYDKTLFIHMQVQNYLTWKAADHHAIAITEELLAKRIDQSGEHRPVGQAMAKLIQFAAQRKCQ